MAFTVPDTSGVLIGIVETPTSAIWTRRYQAPGDFELYVPAAADALAMIADDCYITRADRPEIMIVEHVEIITGVTVEKLLGEESLTGVAIQGAQNREIQLAGLFIAIGLIPQNEAFAELISLNEWGYVDAGEDTLTNVTGIFTAGDCRSKRIRQVATAASDGAVAALAACDYIDSL